MKFGITSKINAKKILKSRGLGESNLAVLKLASVVRTYSDEYVPKQQGTLKNTARIVDTGINVYIVYNQPYAHYQYYGEAMAGTAPKHYIGVPLTYHEAPMRGKEWEKRMMADRGRDVTKALAVYVGGKLK